MEQFQRVPLPREAENAIMTLAEQSINHWPIGQWWVVGKPLVNAEDGCVIVEGYVTNFHEDRRACARVCLPDGIYRANAMFFWDRHPSDWSSNK